MDPVFSQPSYFPHLTFREWQQECCFSSVWMDKKLPSVFLRYALNCYHPTPEQLRPWLVTEDPALRIVVWEWYLKQGWKLPRQLPLPPSVLKNYPFQPDKEFVDGMFHLLHRYRPALPEQRSIWREISFQSLLHIPWERSSLPWNLSWRYNHQNNIVLVFLRSLEDEVLDAGLNLVSEVHRNIAHFGSFHRSGDDVSPGNAGIVSELETEGTTPAANWIGNHWLLRRAIWRQRQREWANRVEKQPAIEHEPAWMASVADALQTETHPLVLDALSGIIPLDLERRAEWRAIWEEKTLEELPLSLDAAWRWLFGAAQTPEEKHTLVDFVRFIIDEFRQQGKSLGNIASLAYLPVTDSWLQQEMRGIWDSLLEYCYEEPEENLEHIWCLSDLRIIAHQGWWRSSPPGEKRIQLFRAELLSSGGNNFFYLGEKSWDGFEELGTPLFFPVLWDALEELWWRQVGSRERLVLSWVPSPAAKWLVWQFFPRLCPDPAAWEEIFTASLKKEDLTSVIVFMTHWTPMEPEVRGRVALAWADEMSRTLDPQIKTLAMHTVLMWLLAETFQDGQDGNFPPLHPPIPPILRQSLREKLYAVWDNDRDGEHMLLTALALEILAGNDIGEKQRWWERVNRQINHLTHAGSGTETQTSVLPAWSWLQHEFMVRQMVPWEEIPPGVDSTTLLRHVRQLRQQFPLTPCNRWGGCEWEKENRFWRERYVEIALSLSPHPFPSDRPFGFFTADVFMESDIPFWPSRSSAVTAGSSSTVSPGHVNPVSSDDRNPGRTL